MAKIGFTVDAIHLIETMAELARGEAEEGGDHVAD